MLDIWYVEYVDIWSIGIFRICGIVYYLVYSVFGIFESLLSILIPGNCREQEMAE